MVLLFTLALSLVTSLFFGFAPARRLSGVSPQSSLRAATQVGSDRSGRRLQSFVAATEIALALVLLIAGGLLLRSFGRLLDSSFGFDPQNAFVVRTIFDHVRYPDRLKRDATQKELLDYRTNWYDPVTLCLLPTLLFAVVLLATWLPARQAAKVDPMQALRGE